MVADLYLERDSFPNTINYNSFIRIDSLISAKIESVARILCFFVILLQHTVRGLKDFFLENWMNNYLIKEDI